VDYVFNATTHKCAPGNPTATDTQAYISKLVMNEDKTPADWDSYVKENQNKVLCPAETPFWNGTKCIRCPDLFNIHLKKCDICE
jgi:hypothetical protein